MSITEEDAIKAAMSEEAGVGETSESEEETKDNGSEDGTEASEETEDSGEEESSEESEEESDDDKEDKEDDDKKEDDFSEAQALEARRIYEALNDPEKAKVLVKFLAEQSGMTLEPAKDDKAGKSEETTGADIVTAESIIADALGKKYAFLAPKLSAGIKGAVELEVKNQTKGIKESVESRDVAQAKTDMVDAQKKLYETYPDAAKLDKEMGIVLKSQAVTMAEGQSYYDYFETIMHVAAGRAGMPVKKSTRVVVDKKKAKRTKNDAATRLASGDLSDGNKSEKSEEQSQNIDDIIKAAMTEQGIKQEG